jgi:hypothetical protein
VFHFFVALCSCFMICSSCFLFVCLFHVSVWSIFLPFVLISAISLFQLITVSYTVAWFFLGGYFLSFFVFCWFSYSICFLYWLGNGDGVVFFLYLTILSYFFFICVKCSWLACFHHADSSPRRTHLIFFLGRAIIVISTLNLVLE